MPVADTAFDDPNTSSGRIGNDLSCAHAWRDGAGPAPTGVLQDQPIANTLFNGTETLAGQRIGANQSSVGFPSYAFDDAPADILYHPRSEEHTSELQSLMRTSSAVFCLKKKKT